MFVTCKRAGYLFLLHIAHFLFKNHQHLLHGLWLGSSQLVAGCDLVHWSGSRSHVWAGRLHSPGAICCRGHLIRDKVLINVESDIKMLKTEHVWYRLLWSMIVSFSITFTYSFDQTDQLWYKYSKNKNHIYSNI